MRTRLPVLPLLAAAGVPLAAVVALTWPLALHLDGWHFLSAFGDSHVWVMDTLAGGLLAGGLPDPTCLAGYPEPRSFRAIGWLPALLFVGLRPLLGALGAANLLQLLALPLASLATFPLLRRWTGAEPWLAAALSVVFALCPTLVATFGTGELPNTQAWILPVFLLALDARRAPLLVPLVGLAAAFTSPYYALALPLLAGGFFLARRQRRDLAALALLGVALLPAWAYYGAGGGMESVFQPARRAATVGPALPHPPPVATPEAWFLAPDRMPHSPFETQHLVYLGPVLVALALAGLLVRRRGWVGGAALAAGGLLLALGPRLAVGDRYLPLPLPVALLEAARYPSALGGLYYRYTVIAVLGLVVLAASALAARRRGAVVAWIALAAQLGLGWRALGPYWPRPVEPVADRAAVQALAGDDGAVLELPLQGPMDALLGQAALLRAVWHRRPTTALPRDLIRRDAPLRRLLAEPGELAAGLHGAGFRYVVLPRELERHSQLSPDALRAALGAPSHEGLLLVWDLGPAVPACTR